MAPKSDKERGTRITMDLAEIIADIDAYPELAGIDPLLWDSLSYPQKCLYLAKRELAAVKGELERQGKTNG